MRGPVELIDKIYKATAMTDSMFPSPFQQSISAFSLIFIFLVVSDTAYLDSKIARLRMANALFQVCLTTA